MSKLQSLFKTAEFKAKQLNHQLDNWYKVKQIWTTNCKFCRAEVRIHVHPHVGFDHIKGPAVNEFCFKGLRK